MLRKGNLDYSVVYLCIDHNKLACNLATVTWLFSVRFYIFIDYIVIDKYLSPSSSYQQQKTHKKLQIYWFSIHIFIFMHYIPINCTACIRHHSYRIWMHSMIIWVHYIRVSNCSFNQCSVVCFLAIDLCKFAYLLFYLHTNIMHKICAKMIRICVCVIRCVINKGRRRRRMFCSMEFCQFCQLW